MDDIDPPYEVGYGKPPRVSRFQKGTSGNPKGRPKGSKNLDSIVLKEGGQRVRVSGPRGIRTVTKVEAVVIQLVNKAAQGDLRAARELLALVQRSEESVKSAGDANTFHELDREVLESL